MLLPGGLSEHCTLRHIAATSLWAHLSAIGSTLLSLQLLSLCYKISKPFCNCACYWMNMSCLYLLIAAFHLYYKLVSNFCINLFGVIAKLHCFQFESKIVFLIMLYYFAGLLCYLWMINICTALYIVFNFSFESIILFIWRLYTLSFLVMVLLSQIWD